MDCKICELKQRQFFCTNCLRAHTRDFRIKTQHFAAERDEQVAKSTKALGGIEGARIRRASVAQIQARVEEIQGALARLRKDNDKKRDRLRTLRESLAERRRTLSAAAAVAPPTTATVPHPTLAAPLAALTNLSALISRARAGLVQELIDVFHVVEVGGRPPLGGKAGSQGEWTIGDLILPVPGDVRRYPPQHINAVLGHAVHFVGLLSWYLGVKLPFTVKWEGGKLGVGVPWIGPGLGGWGRWTASHPLHLSLSPSPIPAFPTHHSTATTSSPDLTLSQSLSGSLFNVSYRPHPSPSPSPSPSSAETPQFTTALAMLLYNVLYLAHTQGIAIPLAQAGDVLSNLWAVCCSPELGRRSHSTSSYPLPPLPPPSPSPSPSSFSSTSLSAPHSSLLSPPAAFAIDFAHVLQAAASGGGRRRAPAAPSSQRVSGTGSGAGGGGVSETRGEPKGRREGKGKGKRGGGGGETEEEEEEEGWDVVSEDGY